MQARIKSPAFVLPGAREALLALARSAEGTEVPRVTLELIHVRVGQLNGCSICVDMHSRALKKLGESEQRVLLIGAWRETPYYTDPERAALALAEAATRLADRPDAVPDDVWTEAARHFTEPALAALVMTIGVANLWNRLNVATRRVTGDWVEQLV